MLLLDGFKFVKTCAPIFVSALAIVLSAKIFAADTLYVGSYNSQQIFRYDQTGTIIAPSPWLGAAGLNGAALKGEGIAVGAGFPTSGAGNTFGNISNPIYIANIGANSVEVVNANAASGANPIVNATFITGLNGVADLALSKNGEDLYVAQQTAGTVSEYNALTGALVASVAVTDAHDVAVSANGTVYVTAYAAGSTQSVGVIDFASNLTNQQTFIAPNSSVAIGGVGTGVTLNHATGMVFDNGGNIWVANVYAPSGSVNGQPVNAEDFVSEYSSTGTLLRTIEATGNHLYTVFGLSLGADGNIYASSFLGNEVTEINDSTGALSTFITMPTGDEPKYAIWGSDFETYSAVPEPKDYAAMTLVGLALLVIVHRLRRNFRSAAV
jgi:hypothetical protein